MSLTPSKMIPIGTIAPEFVITDGISKVKKNLKDLKGSNGTLIVFICNHCPYVIHILEHWVDFSNSLLNKGINTIAISSNDIIKYPQDSPKLMKELALKHKFKFPYLFDHDQKIAKSYDATCTPDFFLFDNKSALFYRGRYDDSRPNNSNPLTGVDLKKAVNSMLNNNTSDFFQYPSMGCNIKWKQGNEPEDFFN